MRTALTVLSDPAVVLMLAAAVACAITDILTAKVYNAVTYPAMAVGLALAAGRGGGAGLEDAAAGWAIGLAVLATAWAVGGIGPGDGKLLMAIGALSGPVLGPMFTLVVIMYSMVVLVAVGLITVIACGEFAASMKRVAAAAGVPVQAPQTPPRPLPGGFCICLGTVWALLEAANRTTLWDWAWSLAEGS
jgi:prepilin peptidase CpaA